MILCRLGNQKDQEALLNFWTAVHTGSEAEADVPAEINKLKTTTQKQLRRKLE